MIADIILILVMALCVFLGYKRGLVKVAVRIISLFAALIIALVLYTPISNYIIENTQIVPTLKTTIEEKLYTKQEEGGEVSENQNLAESMGNYISEYTDELKENTSEVVSEEAAMAIVKIGTWICLFVVARIIMLFVKIFAEAIASLPIIKQFNKLGGTIYGILEGFIIIYGFLAILSMSYPMLKENPINEQIEKSHICKTMYENNLILNIIL